MFEFTLSKLVYFLFLFLIFMFIGWVQESTIESLYHKKFVNRGFLTGPYIPIYGFGGMVILLVGEPLKGNSFLVFLAGMIACTALEYITGAIVEKVLKKQLWDYSMMKFVYKNRISLLSSLFWGALSVFCVYVLFEALLPIVFAIDGRVVRVIVVVMYTVFLVDLVCQVKKNINYTDIIKKLDKDQLRILFEKNFEKLGSPVQMRLRNVYYRATQFGFNNFKIDRYIYVPQNDNVEESEVHEDDNE